MFVPSPTMWVAVGGALLIAALGAGLKIQTSRLDACKAEFEQFKIEVRVLGEQAEKEAKEKEEKDKARLKRVINENAKTKRELASVYDDYAKRLLSDGTGESALPSASADATEPDRACFSRAALDKGLAKIDGNLFEGAKAIIRRGDDAIVELNSARTWAQEK